MKDKKTKICKKCNTPFLLTDKVNGKCVRLYRREFCLNCSPYGSHNTIDLSGYVPVKQIVNGVQCKECRVCKHLKSMDDFYAKSEWGRRYAVCSDCNKEISKKRRNEFKNWCVEYKGGKCSICGYNKCLRSLDFHHLDAAQKDFEISANWKKPKEKIQKELDKCILVCRNCHGEIHDGFVIQDTI